MYLLLSFLSLIHITQVLLTSVEHSPVLNGEEKDVDVTLFFTFFDIKGTSAASATDKATKANANSNIENANLFALISNRIPPYNNIFCV